MSLSNSIIAQFLRNIPQSNQDAQSIKNLCPVCHDEIEYATLFGYVRLLETLGIVQIESKPAFKQSSLKATSQTAKYALMSIADYVSRNETIISDWKTRGLQEHPLANGASFLYALEQERLNRFENIPPSRYVKVAQVLIKRINPENGEHELLFQFDNNAHQYQLVGGRWSEADGADMSVTMVREIEEELPLNTWNYPDSFQLEALISEMEINGTISTTFGALTNYSFWIFHLTGLKHSLSLQDGDYWVPIDMVLKGAVTDHNATYAFASPEIYQRIHRNLPDGLYGLASSFALVDLDQH